MYEAKVGQGNVQENTMRALVYRDPGNKAVENRQKPSIQNPSDAVVKIVKTTFCGTALHILKGNVPTCVRGCCEALLRDACLVTNLKRIRFVVRNRMLGVSINN
jgi:hypothetical protein